MKEECICALPYCEECDKRERRSMERLARMAEELEYVRVVFKLTLDEQAARKK